MNRPHNAIRRTPMRLGFQFPPTEEEIQALVELRQMGAVHDVLAVDKEGARITLLVDWRGSEQPPAALARQPATRPVSPYAGIAVKRPCA